MPRSRLKPLTFKRVDSSGGYAITRWNNCQAIARALYVGPKTIEEIEILFNKFRAEYEQSIRQHQA